MRSLLFIVLFSIISSLCYSQGNVNINDRRNIYDEKGDYYFDQKEYKKAIVYYNMAYKKDPNNYYSILRKAETFTELELFPQAAESYRIIFETDLRISNIYRLQYAFVLLEIGDVTGFEKWLTTYNEIVETEIEGKNYISTAENRAKLYKDSTIIIVENVEELNTPQSEITPVAYDDQVLFASTRQNIAGSSANGFYNIFVGSYADNGKIGKVEVFNNNLNSSQSETSLSFFDVNNSMYFTRSSSQKTQLKTYNANIPYSANESLDITEVTFENFNNVGQLSLNSYGNIMYFVSDATGGNGGLDIYSSELVNGEWAAPKNLGATINTSGDEMYPFVYKDTLLYFASDGHNGLGGLDIYRVNLNQENLSVQNMGSKINSEYDDYSLTIASNGITAYFSSNRPEGAGKEDIYRAHILDLKVKYAAYRFKRKTFMEEDKVNLYLSNGDEYNIVSDDNSGFSFGFQPEEDYKMVIQHENPTAENIIKNKSLSHDQLTQAFLQPEPIDRAEISLEAGMKYQFTAGLNPISTEYINELDNLSSTYQDPGTSTIDLTALAKELSFEEGEVYTIRFVKDDSRMTGYKAKGETSIFVNDETVSIYGRAFFIVLPLDIEANFNIQTDIEHLKENYNAKKYGIVVDKGSVFKEGSDQEWLVSMIINTESVDEVQSENKLTAEDISIIPGTEYLLTLGKVDPITGEDIEIFVPLTRGVKYNLGSKSTSSKTEYKKALAELVIGRKGIEPSNEELIDVSVLSKELAVQPGEDLKFSLLPAKKFGSKASTTPEIKTILNLDGKEYDLTKQDKYTINVPFTADGKVNLQTDINYLLANYQPETISLILDSIPFFGEIIIDTTGFANSESSEWLSMSVNTELTSDVEEKNQFMAQEVSIIPGKEYILTVSKKDALTGKETEIIVPLTRKVKYDFTSNPETIEAYNQNFEEFINSQEEFETTGGEVIDISMLSKELEIKDGDEVSFSLLPAKVFKKDDEKPEVVMSSLFLDSKVVEFTQIQKYTINVPLNNQQVNIQTNIEHLQNNFEPGSFTLDVDTISFFSEITVDTTGYGYMISDDEEITDPVFDVIVVNFDLNKFNLRPEAVKTIEEKVVNELKKDNRLYVTIKGYTDALGNADYNKKLSKDRAQSVKDYLQQNGIGENRIRTFSFGDSQALKEGVNWEDLSEEELQKHRKVEIVIYLPE